MSRRPITAAENCNAEVKLEHAVKGDKLSNGLVENAVMLLCGGIRTIKCHVESCTQEELRKDSPTLPWLAENAESTLSRCQNGRDGQTPFERLHGKKLEPEFETDILRSVEQNESQIEVRSVAGSEEITVPSASWQRQKVYLERARSGG